MAAKTESVRENDTEESGENKNNDYAMQKKRQNEINLAAGEVRRAEEKIEQAEDALSQIQEQMLLYSADYARVQRLADEENIKKLELDALYEKWEEVQQKLESLKDGV